MSCIKNTTRGCCFSADAQGEAVAENCPGCHKLEVFDWMADLPDPLASDLVFEIQFKNTRKGFYLNATGHGLQVGDIVAVEAVPGHDVGIVTLGGALVTKQMKRTGFNPQGVEFRKIFRKVKPGDVQKWQEAIALEYSTMIRSRQLATDLGLNMKIGDVEYQGDKQKAIFYYIAEERVDFRELIKVLADQFRIRVEMRQIGSRQEAGRIGGIGTCGRELCCSTWMNSFSSVTIGAARNQDVSLNPQKLAGQCGKLKCCLNYELDAYIDARREFPRINAPLEAMDGSYYLVKSDIFRRMMWFSPDARSSAVMIPVGLDRVKEIIEMNRRGEKIERLEDRSLPQNNLPEEPQFKNVVGEESITRFDSSRKSSGRSGRGGKRGARRGGEGESPAKETADQNAVAKEGGNENRQRAPRSGRGGGGRDGESKAGESKAGDSRSTEPRSSAPRRSAPRSSEPRSDNNSTPQQPTGGENRRERSSGNRRGGRNRGGQRRGGGGSQGGEKA